MFSDTAVLYHPETTENDWQGDILKELCLLRKACF